MKTKGGFAHIMLTLFGFHVMSFRLFGRVLLPYATKVVFVVEQLYLGFIFITLSESERRY